MKDKTELFDVSELNNFAEFQQFDAVEYYKNVEVCKFAEVTKVKEVSSVFSDSEDKGLTDNTLDVSKEVDTFKNNSSSKIDSQSNLESTDLSNVNSNVDVNSPVESTDGTTFSSQASAEGGASSSSAVSSTASAQVSVASSSIAASAATSAGSVAVASLSGAAVVASVAVAVVSNVIAANPKAIIKIIDRGTDYVSYQIEVLELSEEKPCYVELGNGASYRLDITQTGVYNDIITDLKSFREYEIRLVGENGEIGGTTTYARRKFTTLRDENPTASISIDTYNSNSLKYQVYISDKKDIGSLFRLEVMKDDELYYSNNTVEDSYITDSLYDLEDGKYTFNVYGTVYDEEILLKSIEVEAPLDVKGLSMDNVEKSFDGSNIHISAEINDETIKELNYKLTYKFDNKEEEQNGIINPAKGNIDFLTKIIDNAIAYNLEFYYKNKLIYKIEDTELLITKVDEFSEFTTPSKYVYRANLANNRYSSGTFKLTYVQNGVTKTESKTFAISNDAFEVSFDIEGITSYSYEVIVNDKPLASTNLTKYDSSFVEEYEIDTIDKIDAKFINDGKSIDLSLNTTYQRLNNNYELKLYYENDGEKYYATYSNGKFTWTNVKVLNEYNIYLEEVRYDGDNTYIYKNSLVGAFNVPADPSFEITSYEYNAEGVTINYSFTKSVDALYDVSLEVGDETYIVDLTKTSIFIPVGFDSTGIDVLITITSTYDNITNSKVITYEERIEGSVTTEVDDISSISTPTNYYLFASVINPRTSTLDVKFTYTDPTGTSHKETKTVDIVDDKIEASFEVENAIAYSYEILVGSEVKASIEETTYDSSIDVSVSAIDLSTVDKKFDNTDIIFTIDPTITSGIDNKKIVFKLFYSKNTVVSEKTYANEAFAFDKVSADGSYHYGYEIYKIVDDVEYLYVDYSSDSSYDTSVPDVEITGVEYGIDSMIINYSIIEDYTGMTYVVKFDIDGNIITGEEGMATYEVTTNGQKVSVKMTIEVTKEGTSGTYIKEYDASSYTVDLLASIEELSMIRSLDVINIAGDIKNNKNESLIVEFVIYDSQKAETVKQYTTNEKEGYFSIDISDIDINTISTYIVRIYDGDYLVKETLEESYAITCDVAVTVDSIDDATKTVDSNGNIDIIVGITSTGDIYDYSLKIYLYDIEGSKIDSKECLDFESVTFTDLEFKASYGIGYELIYKEKYKMIIQEPTTFFDNDVLPELAITEVNYTSTEAIVSYSVTGIPEYYVDYSLELVVNGISYEANIEDGSYTITDIADGDELTIALKLSTAFSNMDGNYTITSDEYVETADLEMVMEDLEYIKALDKIKVSGSITNPKYETVLVSISYYDEEHGNSDDSYEVNVVDGAYSYVFDLEYIPSSVSVTISSGGITLKTDEISEYHVDNVNEYSLSTLDESTMEFNEDGTVNITVTATEIDIPSGYTITATIIDGNSFDELMSVTYDGTGEIKFNNVEFSSSYILAYKETLVKDEVTYTLNKYDDYSTFTYPLPSASILEAGFGVDSMTIVMELTNFDANDISATLYIDVDVDGVKNSYPYNDGMLVIELSEDDEKITITPRIVFSHANISNTHTLTLEATDYDIILEKDASLEDSFMGAEEFAGKLLVKNYTGELSIDISYEDQEGRTIEDSTTASVVDGYAYFSFERTIENGKYYTLTIKTADGDVISSFTNAYETLNVDTDAFVGLSESLRSYNNDEITYSIEHPEITVPENAIVKYSILDEDGNVIASANYEQDNIIQITAPLKTSTLQVKIYKVLGETLYSYTSFAVGDEYTPSYPVLETFDPSFTQNTIILSAHLFEDEDDKNESSLVALVSIDGALAVEYTFEEEIIEIELLSGASTVEVTYKVTYTGRDIAGTYQKTYDSISYDVHLMPIVTNVAATNGTNEILFTGDVSQYDSHTMVIEVTQNSESDSSTMRLSIKPSNGKFSVSVPIIYDVKTYTYIIYADDNFEVISSDGDGYTYEAPEMTSSFTEVSASDATYTFNQNKVDVSIDLTGELSEGEKIKIELWAIDRATEERYKLSTKEFSESATYTFSNVDTYTSYWFKYYYYKVSGSSEVLVTSSSTETYYLSYPIVEIGGHDITDTGVNIVFNSVEPNGVDGAFYALITHSDNTTEKISFDSTDTLLPITLKSTDKKVKVDIYVTVTYSETSEALFLIDTYTLVNEEIEVIATGSSNNNMTLMLSGTNTAGQYAVYTKSDNTKLQTSSGGLNNVIVIREDYTGDVYIKYETEVNEQTITMATSKEYYLDTSSQQTLQYTFNGFNPSDFTILSDGNYKYATVYSKFETEDPDIYIVVETNEDGAWVKHKFTDGNISLKYDRDFIGNVGVRYYVAKDTDSGTIFNGEVYPSGSIEFKGIVLDKPTFSLSDGSLNVLFDVDMYDVEILSVKCHTVGSKINYDDAYSYYEEAQRRVSYSNGKIVIDILSFETTHTKLIVGFEIEYIQSGYKRSTYPMVECEINVNNG